MIHTIHKNQHPQAGMSVRLNKNAGPASSTHHVKPGAWVTIEDWWDRVSGMSWRDSNGNRGAMIYGMRTGSRGIKDDALPYDDEVIYGKIEGVGVLVHVLELDGEPGRQAAAEYEARASIMRELP